MAVAFFAVGLMICGCRAVGVVAVVAGTGRAQLRYRLWPCRCQGLGELPWLSPLSTLRHSADWQRAHPGRAVGQRAAHDLGVPGRRRRRTGRCIAGTTRPTRRWRRPRPPRRAIAPGELRRAAVHRWLGGRARWAGAVLLLFCSAERAPPTGQAQITVLDVGRAWRWWCAPRSTPWCTTLARESAPAIWRAGDCAVLAGEAWRGWMVWYCRTAMDHALYAASLWGRFCPGWLLAGEPERLSKERPPIAPQPAAPVSTGNGTACALMCSTRYTAAQKATTTPAVLWAQGIAGRRRNWTKTPCWRTADAPAADVLVVGRPPRQPAPVRPGVLAGGAPAQQGGNQRRLSPTAITTSPGGGTRLADAGAAAGAPTATARLRLTPVRRRISSQKGFVLRGRTGGKAAGRERPAYHAGRYFHGL